MCPPYWEPGSGESPLGPAVAAAKEVMESQLFITVTKYLRKNCICLFVCLSV